MKTKEITMYLDSVVHPEYQEDYDNAGFLLGDPESECSGALLAVDLTPAVIHEAVKKGLSLIVTHHPFIFGGIKRITPENETGRMVMMLIRNGISVYSAHTNLDNLSYGVNHILAQKIGLENCHILRPMTGANNNEIGAGMVGNLPSPVPLFTFLDHLKQTLCLPMLRTTQLTAQSVQRVAICGGSGSFLIGDAMAAGADIYLTGDLKYHEFQRAEGRIILADIGHYESEQFTKELFYSIISEKFSNFACQISDTDCGFIRYI